MDDHSIVPQEYLATRGWGILNPRYWGVYHPR